MKRKIYFYIILVFLVLIFTSCGKRGNRSQENNVTLEAVDNTNRLYIEADSIAINSLSEEEIKSMINDYDNFRTTKSFYINVPESAPVLEFVARDDENRNWNKEEVYQNYSKIYEYLFPDEEFDENLIKNRSYVGYNLDYYEGEREFEFLGDLQKWDNEAFLRLSAFNAWGSSWINKGTLAEMGLHEDDFVFVGLYSPNSTETFKLANKEIAINEAVAFYENYVNNIPYPEKNLDIAVTDVGVYKSNKDIYGYYFRTTGKNHGIILDYRSDGFTTYGIDPGVYNFHNGEGFMIESDDVAYIYNYCQLTYMDDVQQYNSLLSFEDALKKCSESMTKAVVFDVLRAELVYTSEFLTGDDGYVIIDGGYPKAVLPSWKFTLYNENDEKFYDCYVNAKEGTFRYMAYSSGWHDLIKNYL